MAADSEPDDKPLCAWFAGGPGVSSVGAMMFEGFGPYTLDDQLKLHDNPNSYTRECNLLVVDQPAGTGFSYTDSASGYCTDETQVADDMYAFFQAFYERHSEFQSRSLVLMGESYAGKYLPAIATKIHEANIQLKQNDNSTVIPIPMASIVIGDGWTAPLVQVPAYMEYSYSTGLIDRTHIEQLTPIWTHCQKLIDAQQWSNATQVCSQMLGSIVEFSGGVDVYDIRRYGELDLDTVNKYLNQSSVQTALFANHAFRSTYTLVVQHMTDDVMRDASFMLPTLMENYRVVVYNGQFDLICNVVGGQSLYYGIDWSGAAAFKTAKRVVWHLPPSTASASVQPFVAGYARTVGNFTQLVTRGAGHMLAQSQIVVARDLVRRVVQHLPFN
eukprot:TRINITY_DN67718_c6_g1_i2.p1 TRINITY_DN67718_c6_g1~~TRINITY_DN67718_c6_g1_i2.p1  ORF type:complete len:386 (-),score=151.42 TRINITY_DN67718_c6_g1_i2:69-1226(-)